jgi:hypothetical protein
MKQTLGLVGNRWVNQTTRNPVNSLFLFTTGTGLALSALPAIVRAISWEENLG